jgi:uncharacterized Ntn-hydrolase superfamily protein
MLRLAALDDVGATVGFISALLVEVGAVTFEEVLLSAVGDAVLSVLAVGVGVEDAQAVKAITLMARIRLKMFFRFIGFFSMDKD